MMCFEALTINPILRKTELDLASGVDGGVALQVIPGLPDTKALLSPDSTGDSPSLNWYICYDISRLT